MQEDIGRQTQRAAGKTVAITFRASRLTGKILKWAVSAFLNAKYDRGKQDLKHLIGKNAKIEKLEPEEGKELSTETIKILEKNLKKYKVDYSVVKDDSTHPPTYSLFFKGRDAAVIKQCLENATTEWEKKDRKEPVSERLNKFKQKSKRMEGEKQKEKASERGERVKEDAFEK